MKEIRLSQGKVALVDDDDHAWLSQYTWLDAGYGYAVAWVDKKQRRMHRVIMDARPGEAIHHKDGNRLNNQRNNLERMSRSEHAKMHGIWLVAHSNESGAGYYPPLTEERLWQLRSHKSPRATSHYYGVHWDKATQKWMVLLTNRGTRIYGGIHASEVEAAHVHDQKARDLWGDKAPLNFPDI